MGPRNTKSERTMDVTTKQFLNVLGLGQADTIISIVSAVKAASTAQDDEKGYVEDLIGLFNTLATYRHPLTFVLPFGDLDRFVAQYLGKLPETRQYCYAALALLWRSGEPSVHVLPLLRKRLEALQ